MIETVNGMTQHLILTLTWTDRFILVLASSLLAAILSFVSNYAHWRRNKKIEAREAVAKALLCQIDQLDSSVSEYWSKDYNGGKLDEEISHASTIKVMCPQMNSTVTLLFDLHKSSDENLKKQIKNVIEQIYETSTGGSFESKSRTASRSTIMRVSRAVANLRVKILQFTYS